MELINLYNYEDTEENIARGVSHAEASKRKWEAIQRALTRLDIIIGQDCGLCIKYKHGGACEECPLYTVDASKWCGHTYAHICDALAHLESLTAEFVRELEGVIEKEEPGFKPITLTLITKEEADLAWHMLNQGTGETRKQYYRETGMVPPPLAAERDLQKKFNGLYRPQEMKGR